MTVTYRSLSLALVTLGLFTLGGCRDAGGEGEAGGALLPVEGKVTLGNLPIPSGDVFLVPLDNEGPGPSPRSLIGADGSYRLQTDGKAGAPPGKYRAVVLLDDTKGEIGRLFHPIYSNQEKSPLIIDVVEGAPAGGYDLKLKPGR